MAAKKTKTTGKVHSIADAKKTAKPSQADKKLDDAKKKNKGGKPDANFMEETAKLDKTDAITQSLLKALADAEKETERAKKTIALAKATSCTGDLHQLVEMARRYSEEATRILQEAITKGRNLSAKVGVPW